MWEGVGGQGYVFLGRSSVMIILGATGGVSDKTYSCIMVILILKEWLNYISPFV